MNRDDFTKQITSKLDGLARHHKHKSIVIAHVLDTIKQEPRSFYSIWRMSGFALAAAITGFVILPNSFDASDKPQNQVIASPKLSPQMVEDLEMLSVLGEDRVPHGS
ncbi:hypothetical protein D7V21_09250 [Acinetobacter guerrae]|uniref:Uncharacterized protein n=1 Tax=Acinetobacter guerrae TaxID=1843371 RepID=A0A3A8EIQ1_9GAMM|nr:hypothetical protein [Acinetobacter guerrae]RKG33356.1 hypothetical protein D7V21_09250 [Acinetobacter guerrae]